MLSRPARVRKVRHRLLSPLQKGPGQLNTAVLWHLQLLALVALELRS